MAVTELKTNQISPSVISLFDLRDPSGSRCIAVLEGTRPGRIFTDSNRTPNWVVVWERTFGAIYPGENVSAEVFRELIHELRKERVVYLGLWPDDFRWHLVGTEYDHESRVLDFYDRIQDGRLQKFVENLPEGTDLRPINESLIDRSMNRDMNLESALNDLVGFFLMNGDEIISEAIAGVEVMGIREIGIDTQEPYRGQGYATITCARLIQLCEQQGIQTYWNCNKFNHAYVALVRKLGYQTEKEYKLLVWNRKI